MTRLLPLLALAACTDPKPDDTPVDTTPPGCDVSPGCVVAEGLAAALLSVRAPAADDVWVVGASPEPADGTGPVLARFDGASWTRLDTSTWAGAELWWAWVTPAEAVFVGTGGLVLQLDRSTGALTRAEGPGEDVTFFGVWGADASDLWAVGQTQDGQGPPALWRRQAGVWTDASGLLPVQDNRTLFKAHGRAADDLWIVGSLGTAMRWDGAAFTLTDTSTDVDTSYTPLLTVDAGGAVPFAVGGAGNGLLLEHDGEAWRDHSPDFQPGLNGVCTQGGSAWVVGQHGSRAHRERGAWITDFDDGVTAPTLEDWHACAIDPGGALWAVGGHLTSRPLVRGVLAYQGTGDIPEFSL